MNGYLKDISTQRVKPPLIGVRSGFGKVSIEIKGTMTFYHGKALAKQPHMGLEGHCHEKPVPNLARERGHHP